MSAIQSGCDRTLKSLSYGPKNTDMVVEIETYGAVMIMDIGPRISHKKNLAIPQIRVYRQEPNLGRGLSIVQSIAEAHCTTLEFLDKKRMHDFPLSL